MKHNRTLALYAAAALMAAGYTACDEDSAPGASLEVSATEIRLDVHGLNEREEAATLDITATAAWSAHCASWITITPSAGAIGTTQVVVTAGATDEERTGYITFRSGNRQQRITVSQVPYEAVETELAATPATLTVTADGLLNGTETDALPAIAITSNKAWAISGYPAWITPDALTGTPGVTTVQLAVDAYTSPDEDRTATLTVTAGVRAQTVTLTQIRQKPQDDGKRVGFVYFADDFAWATGGSDDLATNTVGTANNIYTSAAAPGSAAGDLLRIFNDQGYTDPCYIAGANDTRVIYFMSDYLKFGKTAYHGGLTHDIPGIDPGRVTNVRLSVDKATYRSAPSGSSSGNYDPNGKAGITTFALIVVLDGPGSVGVNDGATKSATLADMYKDYGTPWAWETASIVLYGVTADTRVTIKTDQPNTAAMLCRYYLDNLKFEKHSAVAP